MALCVLPSQVLSDILDIHLTLTFDTVLAIDDQIKPFGKEARRWSHQKVSLPVSASQWLMRRIVPWFVVRINVLLRVSPVLIAS